MAAFEDAAEGVVDGIPAAQAVDVADELDDHEHRQAVGERGLGVEHAIGRPPRLVPVAWRFLTSRQGRLAQIVAVVVGHARQGRDAVAHHEVERPRIDEALVAAAVQLVVDVRGLN
jgi:hypothetical protein